MVPRAAKTPDYSAKSQNGQLDHKLPDGGVADNPAIIPRFYRYYILGLMFLACSIFYYAGEIVDFFGWQSLHWVVFDSIHDFHRLLFSVPILYAAHAFGIRASVIVTLISGGMWAPRALFISPYPNPVFRAYVSLMVMGTMGYLTALVMNKSKRITKLEFEARTERDRLLGILERMTDGVIIVGPDYQVRFVNLAMKMNFGEGKGLPCYKYIHHFVDPCGERCRLEEVIAGSSERWHYTLPEGITYEVVASPYIDSDGVACQLATYHRINHSNQIPRKQPSPF